MSSDTNEKPSDKLINLIYSIIKTLWYSFLALVAVAVVGLIFLAVLG